MRIGTGGYNSRIHLRFLKACINRRYLVYQDSESGWFVLKKFNDLK